MEKRSERERERENQESDDERQGQMERVEWTKRPEETHI